MNRPVAILLGVLGLVLLAPADDAAKAEFQKLEATWVVTAAEKDGQPLDRIKDGKLIIKDQNSPSIPPAASR